MKQHSKQKITARWFAPSSLSKNIAIPIRRILFFSLIAVVLLAVIGFWTNHAIEESLQQVYASHLQTVLDADVTALKIWIKNEKDLVRSWASETQLRKEVQELVKRAQRFSSSSEVLLDSQNLVALQRELQSVEGDNDFVGFAVIDRSGLILAANKEDPYVGKHLSPPFMPLLARVFQDEVLFEKPYLKSSLVSGLDGQEDRAVMMTAAPIRNTNGTIIAALVFTIDPDKDFTSILSVARMGESGDTYAFGKNGFLLSDCRFEEQLKEIGLITNTPDTRSILSVQIRDPGGDLTRGYQTDTALAARPLTTMAVAAIAGEAGINLEGYRDYRGVKVIGAWRWLPEYEFGVATEIGVAEAFGVLRPLRRAFWVLLAIVVLAAGMLLFSTLFIQRLKLRIDEVKQLGQYTLVEKIGEGGMGKVYKARHALLKRPTAVKLLNPDVVSPETLARFEREVQTTSQLTHPNTIEIYDYGHTPEGIFYYAMEYLPGVSLAQLIQLEGAIPPARAMYILRQICFSLKEAHNIGLIHRDIKPMNVILCSRGGQFDVVKVLDFGLVKDISSTNTPQVTAAQEITGTPAYIAPERLKDPRNIDVRSDLYSLGSVAFNLLTGKDVFEGSNAMEICYHVTKTPPPRPSDCVDTPVPPQLDQLVLDCLAKEPPDRPQNIGVIIEILTSIKDAGQWEQRDAQLWWEKNADRISAIRKT
jgi:hypothetical protein